MSSENTSSAAASPSSTTTNTVDPHPPVPPVGNETASKSSSSERMVPVVCPGHSRPLAELHFSPKTADGVFLVSACLDKLPMLRDGNTGDWIGTFAGHKGAVWSAKLNKEATKAATASADFSVKYWDAVTGKELHTFDHKHIVKTVDISSDGKKLVSGGMQKVLFVHDLEAFDKDPLAMKETATVRKALWHPEDPQKIIAGTDDGTIKVWDVRTGKIAQSVSVGDSKARVMDMELSNQNILTIASGQGVAFFDTRSSFKQLKRYKYDIEMETASLHPKGKCFVAGGADMWVRLFDFATGEELECHKGHHGPVHCLRFHPNGESYTSGSGDATIRIWKSTKIVS